MTKLIFVILFGVLVYVLLRSRRQGPGDGRGTGAAGHVEPMAECAYCRLHVPRSEGCLLGDKFYCSEEHRRLGGG